MRPHDHPEGLGVLPVGVLLVIIVLAALTVCWLWRTGRLTLPSFPGLGRVPSAEDSARRILAERFARGDIDSEDFLERASLLNWTPGSEALPARRRRRR